MNFDSMNIIASSIALVAGIVAGSIVGISLKNRQSRLEEISKLLTFLAESITHFERPIAAILRDYRADCVFVKYMNLDSGNGNLWKQNWEQAARVLPGLKPADRDLLLTLGTQLGVTPAASQREILLSTIEFLKANIGDARQDCERKCGLYRSCGSLIGAIIAIVII